jgi:hypothetical protein
METDIETLPAFGTEWQRLEELKRVPIDDSCCGDIQGAVDNYESEE